MLSYSVKVTKSLYFTISTLCIAWFKSLIGFRKSLKAGDHHLYSVGIRSARSLDSISKAPRAGVDVKGVLHQAWLPTKEHHVKRCVPSRRNYLGVKERL